MLKTGLLHGLFLTVVIILFGAATTFLSIDSQAYELMALVVLFLPLVIVGYKFKRKVQQPLLVVLQQSKNKLLLYPFGIAIFTSALSVYGAVSEVNNYLFLVFLYLVAIFSHAIKFSMAIWVGSWFYKNP